jgi:hypothetical protein
MPSLVGASYSGAVGDVAVDPQGVEAEVDRGVEVAADHLGCRRGGPSVVGSRLAPLRKSRSPFTEQIQSSHTSCRSPVRRSTIADLAVDDHLDGDIDQRLLAEREAATTAPGR